MPEIFGAALMGGGSGPAYAAISVTYPAGATCTCALGSKTLTAPDTSGQALFIVPTAGQWVVKISQSGFQPKSTIVNISASGVFSVSLNFAVYYYTPGNEYAEITGGYAVYSNATLDKTDSGMIMTSQSSTEGSEGICTTQKQIDLSNIKTLYLDCQTNAAGAAVFGPASIMGGALVAQTLISSADRQAYSLDISSLSGSYFIIFKAAISQTTIYNLWGE